MQAWHDVAPASSNCHRDVTVRAQDPYAGVPSSAGRQFQQQFGISPMIRRTPVAPTVAVVLGCGDVGSAVAHALHTSGWSVVLVDEADPPWHRRGMSFTNAWYVGTAELDGEGACFCASLKSIPSVHARRMIAATTWSWPSVAAALDPTVLVDARGRRRRDTGTLRGRLPITIRIGRDFVEGESVDVALDLPSEVAAGHIGEPVERATNCVREPESVIAADCIVEAVRYGRFMTERRIGDTVRPGQIVGGLGNVAVAAPVGGVLLGLAARGARIEPGDILVQVEPQGAAHNCYGLGEGPRRIAERVLALMAYPARPVCTAPRLLARSGPTSQHVDAVGDFGISADGQCRLRLTGAALSSGCHTRHRQ
jgi:xanthine dehydrogenase accessory factor